MSGNNNPKNSGNKIINNLIKNLELINKNQNKINININNLSIKNFSIDIINQILYELRPVNQLLLLRSSSGGPGNGPPNRPYTTTNNNEDKKRRIINEIANYVLARIIIITQLYTLNYNTKQILLSFIENLINQRINELRNLRG